MRKNRKQLEKIIKVDRLIEDINKVEGLLIIVEGKSDSEGLKKLGVKKKIIIYNNKFINQMLERDKATNKRLLILTDFDTEGQAINKKITKYAESLGYKVEKEIRKRFRKETRKYGEEIYGIAKVIRDIKLYYQIID